MAYFFTPPTSNTYTPATDPTIPLEKQSPWRYFSTNGLIPKPPNVWLKTDNTLTTSQPPESEIRTVFLGGHRTEVTAAQRTILIAGGYTVEEV